MTPRERLHLNFLQQADYRSLRYDNLRAARGIVTAILICAAFWAFVLLWWLS